MSGDTVPVKSIRLTFKIIETLAANRSMHLAELSDRLDIPKSTAHDHLRTLEQLGYVTQDEFGFRTSTRFTEVGERSRRQFTIYDMGKQQVQALAERAGAFTTLLVEEAGIGVILYTAQGTDIVDIEPYPGTRLLLHTTAPGKAILAKLPDERVEEIVETHGFIRDRPRYGIPESMPNTITTPEALAEELDRIRRRGYATADEELIGGISGVGAAIEGGSDVLGAVGIHVPSSEFDEARVESDLVPMLRQTVNVFQLKQSYSQR